MGGSCFHQIYDINLLCECRTFDVRRVIYILKVSFCNDDLLIYQPNRIISEYIDYIDIYDASLLVTVSECVSNICLQAGAVMLYMVALIIVGMNLGRRLAYS